MRALGPEAYKLLTRQLEASVHAVAQLEGQALDQISTKQREINRLATPNIERSMVNVYKKIVKESGNGCFGRGKDLMVKHIESSKKT